MTDPLPCGCCEGITAEPVAIDNRPGLSALAYRSGTWAQFKASMLDALSTTPALAALRTRSDDDFTIALLDAWAVVCDILTFYQERIANESYLRTATERVSVGELAKLIGYKLRPGLAASVALAFTLDVPVPLPPGPSTPPSGSPPSIALAPGTKTQTVPDPGAQPATFETTAAITARAAWNAIAPRLTRPAAPSYANAGANVRLAGLTGTVKVGDSLLVAARNLPLTPRLGRVKAIEPDTATQTTLVRFEADRPQAHAPLPTTPGTATAGASLNDDFLWASVKGAVWEDQAALVAFATAQGWSVDALENGVNALRQSLAPGDSPPLTAAALGIDAALFGHNAPNWNTLPSSTQDLVADWEGFTLATIPTPKLPWIDLDGVYPVVVGDRVYLQDGAFHFATTVAGVQVLSRSAYLLSSKVTSIELATLPAQPFRYLMRSTRVLVETAPLPLAGVAWDDVVETGSLMLDGAYLSLAVGQLVALSGVRADKQGETGSEVVTIAGLSLVDGYTVVTFDPELAGTYVRATVRLDANVAPATHGESTTEILGSGDASQPFQRFALKQPPLTYVSAATPSGSASTLTVRVDGVAWTEVAWLYGSGPTDRVYTVLTGVDGVTYVQFGDGVTGARPGSGTGNIQATYRHGTGSAGLARAGQVSMLLSRPLGLNAVTNPLPSSGAADPETIDQARPNAPITVKTIDRVVSLKDAGDFAAASAGIAKSAVSWIWDGSRYVACVTVAGTGGAPVLPGTPQYASLLQALRSAGDGTMPVTLCSFVAKTFTVAARIVPDPALVPGAVLAGVKAALAATFSFANRAFGQPVFRSEVIAALQGMPGVVAVTLSDFALTGAVSSGPVDALVASAPTLGPHGLIGAELLTLEPGPLPRVVLA